VPPAQEVRLQGGRQEPKVAELGRNRSASSTCSGADPTKVYIYL
jgi:hypothetical protein